MEESEFPKLHLPPWFYESGAEEYAVMKEWTAVAFVEVSPSEFVKPMFISPLRLTQDLDHSGEAYWYDVEVVVLKTVSFDEIKRLLPILKTAGVFNGMRKYHSATWEE